MFRSGYKSKVNDFGISFDPALGKTKSEFAASCDLTAMVKRVTGGDVKRVFTDKSIGDHFLTNILPTLKFADYSAVPTYDEALNLIMSAEESFFNMSSSVRSRFDNSPSKFMDFMSDPSNLPEAVSLGLVNPPPVDKPVDSV